MRAGITRAVFVWSFFFNERCVLTWPPDRGGDDDGGVWCGVVSERGRVGRVELTSTKRRGFMITFC